MLVCSSDGGLCFTEKILFVRFSKVYCKFLRVLHRGSVIPLIYGNVAYPVEGSEGSTSSKNRLTKSSRLGVVLAVWVLITIEMSVLGYPFEMRASLTCFSSWVVGRLRDLLVRVVAMLILCFMS